MSSEGRDGATVCILGDEFPMTCDVWFFAGEPSHIVMVVHSRVSVGVVVCRGVVRVERNPYGDEGEEGIVGVIVGEAVPVRDDA